MRDDAATGGRASREAIDWLIQLQENADDLALRAQFDRWLAAHPAHREAWGLHARTYEVLADAPGDMKAHWQVGGHQIKRGGFPRLKHPKTLLALAAAACLAILVAPDLMLRVQADHITGTAQLARVSLPDGSTATLAPDSAIRIGYSSAGREVRLLAGEAFFDVRHDASRPFNVLSGDMKTVVLGTAFDVRLRDETVRVAVRRGHVRAGPAEEAGGTVHDLFPGQWAEFRSDGSVGEGSRSPAYAGAWTEGRLMFDDRPVSEALRDLGGWFDGVIILANAELGARRITATVDPGDPAEAARALVSSYGGSVRRISPWLLIVS